MWTQLDAAIVGFFNPLAVDPAVRAPVRNNWPLQRLDHAVYVAAAYFTGVLACILLLKKKNRTTGGGEKKKLSVAEKIKQEGLLIFVAMAIYNATQVALCGWMVYASLSEHRRRGLKLVCNEHNLAEDGMAFVLHVFYISKVLDFADTIFMIVKGNWHQVSFLHVYHHTSVFLVYWLNAQTNYDADIYFTIVLNGSIHFIMYGYYLATSFNVTVPMFIKKSITNAQLIQFCLMELQGFFLLSGVMGTCGSPRNVTILYMVYISTMLILFMDFKRRAYASSKKSKAALSSKADKSGEVSSDDASTVASESEVVNCCGFEYKKQQKVRKVSVKDHKVHQASTTAAAEKTPVEKVIDSTAQRPSEIYIDGKLYDVANFRHPGGTIIKFYQGSGDATATVGQFHNRSKKYAKYLASLPSRPAPAEVSKKNCAGKEELAADFQKLVEKLKADGFFEPHMGAVVYRISELIVMFAIGIYLLLACDSLVLRFAGLMIIGLAEGRCGWLMHEGGHGSLTGDIMTDRTLQIWLYGLGCGMSAGWWRSQHNRHHATPQKLKHDADLDTLPLVAFNEACTRGVKNPALRKWLQAQAYLFMPLTCFLVVLGWQLALHPRYIVLTKKWGEMSVLVLRYILTFKFLFAGFSWTAALGCYLLVQQIAGSYIFTNFAMSHTHLDVTQPDEHVHWVEYACNHTTNLSDHWFVNWWMAYLNFQIEHHLFPSMPQFRHPETSKRVKELFKKHGLKYDVRGYFSCLGDTLKNLNEVGHHDHRAAPRASKKEQ
jgi:fatty acid desaturase